MASPSSSSPSSQPRRTTLNDLPEDVLVTILSFIDIWDVFSFRLSSRTVHSVISSSIRSVSRQICLNTFPDDRMLAKRPANGTGEWDFDWLRDRIPRKLAAVLLDNSERPVPAESEWGEVARYRVARGWKVLKQLSGKYDEVYQMDDETVLRLGMRAAAAAAAVAGMKKGQNEVEGEENDEIILGLGEEEEEEHHGEQEDTTNGKYKAEEVKHKGGKKKRWKGKAQKLFHQDLTVLQAREDLALARCKQVISNLRKCDALGFMLLWDRLVCGPFRTYPGPYQGLHEDCPGRRACLCPSHCGTLAPGIDPQGDNIITLERGNCWMTWFIIRHGPGMFFRQWCGSCDHAHKETFVNIGDQAHTAWKGRSKKHVEVERTVGAMIWASVWMRAWSQRGRKSWATTTQCGGDSSGSGDCDGKGSEIFNPSRILRPEYLWWDDSISQGGLGSSSMPWVSFIFEEQPMWQELYDDYGSPPIRGQVLWLLWKQGKIGLDDDFDVDEMLATTEDVDDLFDAFWTCSFSENSFDHAANYRIEGYMGRNRRKRRRDLQVGKTVVRLWGRFVVRKLLMRGM